MSFATIDDLQRALATHEYVADRPLATAIFLALKLQKPLLLEGEAGVGKTEVAKTLATMLGRHLIRLQCYEGLDVNTTIYEWNYTRQMLQIRLLESIGATDTQGAMTEIFGPEFLIKRPLLQAIEESQLVPPVLLIDEIDRADEEFEAFLLELLSDWQISIPEIGTIRAAHRDHHQQSHARGPRRAQAPLPVLLDRLPDARKGAPDRRRQGAGRLGAA